MNAALWRNDWTDADWETCALRVLTHSALVTFPERTGGVVTVQELKPGERRRVVVNGQGVIVERVHG